VDVLQRAGRFDEAVGAANELLDRENLDTTIGSIVAFSRKLALCNDKSRYTVEEALASELGESSAG
jgi:hypothetical protein